MVQGQTSDSGWFSNWVNRHLGLCLTLAHGLSLNQMLEGFGLRPREIVEATFTEVTSGLSRPMLRVGDLDD